MSNDHPLPPGEVVICRWESFLLTSTRVSGGGSHGYMSLPLRSVQFAGIQHNSYPLLLVAAALLAAAMLFGPDDFRALTGIGLVGSIVAYFVTRETRVVVGAGSGVVAERLTARKAKREEALIFVRVVMDHVASRGAA